MAPAPSEARILELVHEHSVERHAPRPFDPAAPEVKVSGRVFGPEEVVSLVRASLDFWLTDGPETVAFQRALARRTGHRHAVLVNSGSSANLVALSALTSPALGRRRLRPGDEVLTVAAGFPTTYGYDHKYVYSHVGYNLKATDLQAAIGRVQLERLE